MFARHFLALPTSFGLKLQRYVLPGIFLHCPSSLGLKQQNTNVMFCEAFFILAHHH
jgi:hypothetical protein